LTLEFEGAGRALLAHRWIFARTMSENPHEYTLRREWEDDAFVRVVRYIREHGYRAVFKGRAYMQLDVNEHFYWTMGAPLDQTILINRKVRRERAYYDAVAPVYDGLFTDIKSLRENAEAVALLGDVTGESVLDVGCGTGLLLDYARPARYMGVDPSGAMLDRLLAKHPERRGDVVNAPLRSFVGDRVDVVVSLFGSASYLMDDELRRVPTLVRPGGRWLLMFYSEGYEPVTHAKTGVFPPTRTYAGLPEGRVSAFYDYTVVEGPG